MLLLGVATGRVVLYYTSMDTFNPGSSILSPDGAIRPARHGLPATEGYRTREECRQTLEQVPLNQRLLPYTCSPITALPESSAGALARQGRSALSKRCDSDFRIALQPRTSPRHRLPHSHTPRWLPRLEDGLADEYIKELAKRGVWDRDGHKLLPPARQLSELFPSRAALLFNSPSVTAAFVNDFVAPRTGPSSSVTDDVRLLAQGATEYSGPSCLLRRLVGRTTPTVLNTVRAVLAPLAQRRPAGKETGGGGGALLVGLHVRRGDKAMMGECRECINLDDPDVQPGEKDRIELQQFVDGLHSINASVSTLRRRLQRDAYVFVASDTNTGLHLSRRVLGASSVLSMHGQAVHTTRTLAHATPDAVKVAVDLLCLAVSDVLFSLGGSSFSGAAGALQLGVSRVGEQHSQAGLEEHEIQQVLSSFTET